MNPASSATAPLLFHWEPPRRRRLAITMFVIGSIIAHALCFYVFQIVYPPIVSLVPPPARISLIIADSEQSVTLLRWIDSEDPALAFATHRPPEARLRALPKISHVPSYVTSRPILKDAPPLATDLRAPSAYPPGSIQTVQRNPKTTYTPLPSSLSLSEELAQLGSPTLPEFKFKASSPDAPANVRFRIAVSSTGIVRHSFRLDSSGDPALDEQARNYLMLARFPAGAKSDGKLTWGVATIEWGNDVARPQPKPESP